MSFEFDVLDFQEWLEFGIANGWVANPSCYFHDSIPATDEEEAEIDEGGDPCINVIRVWNF